MKEIALLRQYKIPAATFQAVRDFLQAKPVNINGAISYKLTKTDKSLLSCSRLHPRSFPKESPSGLKMVPFYRYFIYLCLTHEEEDIVDILISKHLVKKNLAENFTKKYRSYLKTKTPETLKKIIGEAAPVPDKVKPDWKNLIKVINIEEALDNPFILNSYDFILNNNDCKAFIDSLLATSYDEEELITFVNKTFQLKWQPSDLHNYIHYFFDLDYLTTADWNAYISLMPVHIGAKVKNARFKPFSEYLIKHNMAYDVSRSKLLQKALKQTAKDFFCIEAFATESTIKAKASALNQMLKLVEKLDNDAPDVAKYVHDLAEFVTKKDQLLTGKEEEWDDIRRNSNI